MARKPVTRSLPALRNACPHFRGFAPKDNRVEQIVKFLEGVIERIRRNHPISFYSMRETAKHFGVSLKTVGDAYTRLEAQGQITCLRGSQTLIQGYKLQPRHSIRGVVGLPVFLPGFMIGTVWRTLFMRLEAELRRRHFVADFIFYREQDEGSPDLGERMVAHKLDTIFWWAPSKALAPILHRLLDGGIQVVVVSNGQGHFPREQYFLNLERAYEEGIVSWRRKGISSVTILNSTTPTLRQDSNLVIRILQQQQIAFSTLEVSNAEIVPCINRLARKSNHGVILPVHAWYEQLCFQYPQAMEKLFRGCRTLLMQESVYQPYFCGKNVRVDSIRFDCEKITKRIARDISSQRTNTSERLATFYTSWAPDIDLGSVSRDI
ncbi:MAG: hypothetical protein HY360_01160 [Verrucomicrobia bacterium]|nr:hypothetical protein [Verrucomicrobiota bacterium]